MKSKHYLTLTEFLETNQLETYELEHGCEFSSFDHEVSCPMEGTGYFIQQDDLNEMLEIVNSSIQQQFRHRDGTGSDPYHLVTSESAAGALRVGLPRPKTVIGFPDFFSIGPLWHLERLEGQKFRDEWLSEHINFEMDDFVYENKFRNAMRELEDIPEQSPIYIWYADNADEQVGLRFFLYLLRNKKNEIHIVNASECPGHLSSHTAQLSSEKLHALFAQHQVNPPLEVQDRLRFQKEWEDLSQTMENLRICENRHLVGVSEEYYDVQILDCIRRLHIEQGKNEFITVGEVIGEFVAESTGLMNIFFLEYRIRHLVYSGMLELKGIPKSMRHYRVKIQE